MSIADAWLVRLTAILPDPLLLNTLKRRVFP